MNDCPFWIGDIVRIRDDNDVRAVRGDLHNGWGLVTGAYQQNGKNWVVLVRHRHTPSPACRAPIAGLGMTDWDDSYWAIHLELVEKAKPDPMAGAEEYDEIFTDQKVYEEVINGNK